MPGVFSKMDSGGSDRGGGSGSKRSASGRPRGSQSGGEEARVIIIIAPDGRDCQLCNSKDRGFGDSWVAATRLES
jgi:hypothetical protein